MDGQNLILLTSLQNLPYFCKILYFASSVHPKIATDICFEPEPVLIWTFNWWVENKDYGSLIVRYFLYALLCSLVCEILHFVLLISLRSIGKWMGDSVASRFENSLTKDAGKCAWFHQRMLVGVESVIYAVVSVIKGSSRSKLS